ncbi:MAG: bifunctional UDP-sugar hydrolase/5'-nucleotidase [Vicinamibacterales bacterium]
MAGLLSRVCHAFRPRWLALSFTPAVVWLLAAGPAMIRPHESSGPVTLSLVGTTDLHGQVFPRDGRGGLALLGGYLRNLRAARAADGGAVLLFDSGDTYLDGIESNLSEGAIVIDAYNALGYTAAAVGNHDFDFGAIDEQRFDGSADRRGALKARAAQARFPFLAANLHEHGRAVEWPNVRPSTLVEAAGVRVGVIGVMTRHALSMTLASNVIGLEVTALADAIEAEAARLRARGAALVVVASHAGGSCTAFDRPTDLGSCDDTAEIFEVVRALPRGLVDVVFAGHTHAAVAHQVNGVAIVQAYARGRAFSRVDVMLARADESTARNGAAHVASVRLFPPREVCAREDAGGRCLNGEIAGLQARYEGRPVVPDPTVDAAMAPALARVRELQNARLGPVLETPVSVSRGTQESALANLFADAMREVAPGTDAAIGQASGPGGPGRGLPAGPATFGALYQTFPFDNLVVRRTLTGAQLRQVLTSQLRRPRWGGRAFGVSGVRVRLGCRGGAYDVAVERAAGRPVEDHDVLVVAMSDFLAARITAIAPESGEPHAGEPAVQMMDAVASWLRARGGTVSARQFSDPSQPRWARTAEAAAGCPAD